MTPPPPLLSRRRALAGLGLGTLAVMALPGAAQAGAAEMEAALRDLIGPARAGAKTGRILIDLPPLAESGNSVPLKVAVESPMTEADHVRRILVFADRNPRALIADFRLGPRSGRAEVGTNIRLSGTQNVIVYAQMSDGTYYTRQRAIEVTIGACDSLLLRF
jgi:sulfur-oxidizing protein SoxY